MNVLQSRRKKLSAALAELEKVEKLHSQIEALVKKEGFASLGRFMAKLDRSLGKKDKPAAATPKKGKKKGRTGKRPRLTDKQLAQMKSLHGKDVPPADIAAKLKISVQSVHNWAQKKFKR